MSSRAASPLVTKVSRNTRSSGGVTREGQLRQQQDVDRVLFRPRHGLENQRGIALDIAHRRIDLGSCNA